MGLCMLRLHKHIQSLSILEMAYANNTREHYLIPRDMLEDIINGQNQLHALIGELTSKISDLSIQQSPVSPAESGVVDMDVDTEAVAEVRSAPAVVVRSEPAVVVVAEEPAVVEESVEPNEEAEESVESDEEAEESVEPDEEAEENVEAEAGREENVEPDEEAEENGPTPMEVD